MTDPDKVRELVTTIEVYHRKCEDDGGEPCEELTAARTLTALLQRVTELEGQRDEALRQGDKAVRAERAAARQQVAALREALRAAQKMRDLMRLGGPRAQVVTPMDIATGHFDAAVHRLAPYLSEGEKE